MRRLTRRLYGLLVSGLVVGWLTPAAGQAISCGATLGPGGNFVLEADLDCGTVSPALTVRDGAHLDLGGHTISIGDGSASGSIALRLDGQGALVTHGIVQNNFLLGDGVEVAGEGGHTVRQVSVFARGIGGIVVTSDQNRLINNVAASGIGNAVQINGNQNLLRNNLAAGGQGGFSIGGDENRLVENGIANVLHTGFTIGGNQNLLLRNTAANTDTGGFGVSGDGNRLVGNLALDARTGFSVTGQNTVITGNTALDNSFGDLFDAHEDCDNNQWTQNVFRTSRAGATENPACIR
jgi:hypothetical protein